MAVLGSRETQPRWLLAIDKVISCAYLSRQKAFGRSMPVMTLGSKSRLSDWR